MNTTPIAMSHDPIQGRPEGAFSNLRRRIHLTYTHFGLRTILWRLLTFPLRFTPLHRRMRLRTHARDQERRRAATWYREHGTPVDIVIPSYRDAAHVRTLVRSIQRTTARGMARVIVADDAAAPSTWPRCGEIDGIDVLVESERNSGFAANVNRGLRASAARARRGRAELRRRGAAEAGSRDCSTRPTATRTWASSARSCSTPTGASSSAAPCATATRPSGSTTATASSPATGARPRRPAPRWRSPARACTCAARSIERVGMLDERYPMAYEDVDWCLRAWQAGYRVRYFPIARLVHHESVTRGTTQGERELESQRLFWERWSGFFERS